MLNKLEQLRKNRESGFTIIEVMIVLAIAGLILLIVLLAVPALQRNSRNTQIKNDAANIVGAISTFATDNDGTVPNKITISEGTVTIWKGSGTTPAAGDPQAKAEIQKGTTLDTGGVLEATANAPTTVEPGTLKIQFGTTCYKKTTTTRSVSVYYSIETSNGKELRCTNS